VLDNLLSNAIKYSPDGGPVTVRVARAGTTVQVQVADRGMGMRPEDAEHVFGRFFRSSNARMSAIPGLGLGLAVVHEIVERHGGTIGCESAPGEGTVFTLILPAAGPVGAEDPDRAEQGGSPAVLQADRVVVGQHQDRAAGHRPLLGQEEVPAAPQRQEP
jgi:signal transduction histidine kinase